MEYALAYEYMRNRAKETGDQDVIQKLEPYDPYAVDFPNLDYLVKGRTELLNKYGIGHLHRGLTTGEMLNALFVFQGYTAKEKINWFLGADFSMVHLFPVILDDSLFESSTRFEVPFYIIQGTYDYQVSQVLASEYLDALEAPKKAYFEFSDSAHSPNMEEPEGFVEIFREIASENPSVQQGLGYAC